MSHAPACQIHRYHSPHVAETEIHHVVPLAWGGPADAANQVSLCPTGHRNVHELLGEFSAFGGPPPWEVLRAFSAAERELARRGWEGASRA